jgi:hypothetical protein
MPFRSRCVCITVNVGTMCSRNRAVTPALCLLEILDMINYVGYCWFTETTGLSVALGVSCGDALHSCQLLDDVSAKGQA